MPDEYFADSFVWERDKSVATLRRRGFDFVYASRIFENDHVELFDEEHSWDEDRFVCIGLVGDACLTARKSTEKERELYVGYFR